MNNINNLGQGTPNQGTTSIYDFFENLASFDTETTGVDTKKDRVWQAGFTKKGIDAQVVVNPFFDLDSKSNEFLPKKLSNWQFSNDIRFSNGKFSEEASLRGDFNDMIREHRIGTLSNSLSDTLDNTLGNLSRGDVLVLQNHNFENKLIQQGYTDGLIEKTTYERLQEKMEYTTIGKDGGINGLLTPPTAALSHTRDATFLYNAKYLDATTNKREVFNKYTATLNKAMDAYRSSIEAPNRGAVVVEQMDVTKALYANAIQAGLMDSQHAQVGLKMDFLTNALYGRVEKHTALSDSKDTLEVFRDTWRMVDELRTNKVSDKTKKILVSINDQQYKEVHGQFMDSVTSVLKDFEAKGFTKYSARGNVSIFPTHVHEATTGNINILRGQSSGFNSKITVLDTALDNILSRYSQHGNTDVREAYIDTVKKSFASKGLDKTIILTEVTKDNFNLDSLPTGKPVSTNSSWWAEPTELLGRQMSRKAKVSIIGGTILGLGYMWGKDSPEKQEENSYVSQQFYDEQYLGTQFVNFNERNKHYMY